MAFLQKNMIASFYTSNKYNIGDKITVDGVSGTIVDLDKSSISIKTENSKVVFPLNKVVNQKVEFHD